MTSKETGEAIPAIGPAPEQSEAADRSFFDTLLGQATAALGSLTLYVTAVALLHDKLLAMFAAYGPYAFWSALLLPVALIFVVQVLPTALRARRERRLYPLARAAQTPPPGYFRLFPYETSEAGVYRRPDGATELALTWIRRAPGSVLYLTGASGSGKSSLVAAGMTPALEAEGWRVLSSRGLGKTYQSLAAGLAGAFDQPGKSPPDQDVYQHLVTIGAGLKGRGVAGLLIVIDQFEEFLILEHEDERRAFADLLTQLASHPIAGVRLLLVFREDYRALLFKQGLPAYDPGRTAFELAPFSRREAEAFLRGGPSTLDQRGYDALFAGLDRVDGTRGLYRPVTLNMVGLVLERTGSTLADDPARLIERYLADCLSAGAARDFAKPVLEAMITREGTKEPRTETELAALAGLQPWQVRATLVDLRQDGLVRPLDEQRQLWEISHDFLARILGRLLGRLRSGWVQRTAPVVLGIAGAGWLAVMLLAVPYALQQRETAILGKLQKLNFVYTEDIGDGIALEARGLEVTDEKLQLASALALRLASKVRSLDLTNTGVTELAPLAGLTQLQSLKLSYTGVTELAPLAGLTQLQSLDLIGTGVTELAPLAGLTQLQSLDLSNTGVTELAPLAGLTQLQSLDLFNTGVTELAPLAGLTQLQSLDLFNTGVTKLAPLAGLTQLQSLDLIGTGVTELAPLAGLTQLQSLDLIGTGVTELAPLAGLMQLQSLDLTNAGVTELAPLAGLTQLQRLDLSNTGVTDLTPLKDLQVVVSGP